MSAVAWQLYEAVAPNGKRYIGITSKTLEMRAMLHCRDAKRPRTIFHKALQKYDGAIVFRTLALGEQDYIHELEARAIEAFQTRDRRFGYNLAIGGRISPMLVPEIAVKSGVAKRGRKLSAEHKAKVSAAQIGRDNSKAIAAMSTFRRGRPLSSEHKARIGAANSIANAGKKRVENPLSRAEIARRYREHHPDRYKASYERQNQRARLRRSNLSNNIV